MGKPKIQHPSKNHFYNLNFDKNIKALRSDVSGIRACSAVRRGEFLEVSVKAKRMEAFQGISGDRYL